MITIRSRVLAFAEGKSNGFTDDDVRGLDPEAPESSFRKRRSELTDEGFILDTGIERDGHTVWVHRKFHPAPPPIKVRVKGAISQALARRKQETLMFNALVAAAPHHQGAHSLVGSQIAKALNIPFPITYNNIPAAKPAK